MTEIYNYTTNSAERGEIFQNIEDERDYQDNLWGTDFDDKNTPNDWATYVIHYLSKATVQQLSEEDFAQHMVKVAAIAIAALEAQLRNDGYTKRHYDK